MKIKFQKNPEQLELIKQMGSKNHVESLAAQEAFAALMQPIVSEAFTQADTLSWLYRDMPYMEDDDPSFPIDIFNGVTEDHYTVWSQTVAGGLPTNNIFEPISEVKFNTYRLDSAISYKKKYARKLRMDVIARAIERLMEEVLVKAQHNGWSVILAALANASHNIGGVTSHVFRTMVKDQLQLPDLNKMLTKSRRMNASGIISGTSVGNQFKPTDMCMSPETMEMFRAMAYQPINTKGANQVNADENSPAIALPDVERAKIFANAGVPEIFGLGIVELLEFGKTQVYQVLFDSFSSASLTAIDGGANTGAFDATNDELIIFVDASKDFAYRAIETSDPENNSTFQLATDDQFTNRSETIGQYGHIVEGRVVLETRGLTALVM